MSYDTRSDSELIDNLDGSPSQDGGGPTEAAHIPADAFISPDEPVRDTFRDAMISPDDPIPAHEDEGGVVVGMDGSPDHGSGEMGGVQLDLEQIASVLEDVASGIRERGVQGLRATPGTPRFETVLKAYLAGYLSIRS